MQECRKSLCCMIFLAPRRMEFALATHGLGTLGKVRSRGRTVDDPSVDKLIRSTVRFALNFKSIPYETEWVPFIHLQETLRSLYVL